MRRFTLVAAAFLLVTATGATVPAQEKGAPAMDVVFALDTTGSMSDEIVLVRQLVWDLANGIITGKPRPSIRLGLVRYRDKGDAYVAKVTPLTFDLDAVHKVLMKTRAGGGGDTPEHVSLALHRAVGLKWRAGADKIVFLIGDAAPKRHGDYFHDREARRAKKLGVTLHAIGCSGLTASGEADFKRIASLSGGSYAPLPRTSSRRGSASDIKLRNLILTRAGLARYATTPPAARRSAAPAAPAPRPTAPPSADTRDKRYAPTPDRVWSSRVK
jgi:Mg-chelatase subunit ChlD